jgi:ferredoxin
VAVELTALRELADLLVFGAEHLDLMQDLCLFLLPCHRKQKGRGGFQANIFFPNHQSIKVNEEQPTVTEAVDDFMINVIIDREGCISCGQCWDACPNFFEENAEDGWSQVEKKFRIAGKVNEGVAFEHIEECVKQAAEGCPAQVIHVGALAIGFDPL